MRIVYFLPDVEAGVSRIVRNLLAYKPESDVSYIVVLMRHKESPHKNPVNAPFDADETIIFEYNSLDNLYVIYKRMASLISPDDIIVGNDGYEIRMVTALKLKNPVVYIIHGDFDYYYLICKLSQSVVNLFIAYSEKIYRQLRSDLHEKNKEKVNIIYYPSAAVDNVENNSVKEGMFKIVFAGALEERKGAHLLLDIYIELVKTIPSFELEIIGDGELKETLSEQFKDTPKVTISGWQTNQYILKRFSQSQVFLFPSFSEGLPNVLVEALSRGAVPVSSDLSSGVRDIIENEKNGLLVNTGDVKAFARAITFLYDNPARLKSMRELGILQLNRFDPRTQAKAYHEKIIALASKPATSTLKDYPIYPLGGWLNKPYIPNIAVRAIRKLVKHPKL